MGALQREVATNTRKALQWQIKDAQEHIAFFEAKAAQAAADGDDFTQAQFVERIEAARDKAKIVEQKLAALPKEKE